MSTIISGNHEFSGVEIVQGLNTQEHVGCSASAKAYVASKVNEQLVEIVANEDVTNMAAFVTYATSDGRVGFHAVDMGTGEDHAKARATVTSATYNLALEKAQSLYYALYGQVEVMFNDEDQGRISNQFCFGDINNNFWLEE